LLLFLLLARLGGSQLRGLDLINEGIVSRCCVDRNDDFVRGAVECCLIESEALEVPPKRQSLVGVICSEEETLTDCRLMPDGNVELGLVLDCLSEVGHLTDYSKDQLG